MSNCPLWLDTRGYHTPNNDAFLLTVQLWVIQFSPAIVVTGRCKHTLNALSKHSCRCFQARCRRLHNILLTNVKNKQSKHLKIACLGEADISGSTRPMTRHESWTLIQHGWYVHPKILPTCSSQQYITDDAQDAQFVQPPVCILSRLASPCTTWPIHKIKYSRRVSRTLKLEFMGARWHPNIINTNLAHIGIMFEWLLIHWANVRRDGSTSCIGGPAFNC